MVRISLLRFTVLTLIVREASSLLCIIFTSIVLTGPLRKAIARRNYVARQSIVPVF